MNRGMMHVEEKRWPAPKTVGRRPDGRCLFNYCFGGADGCARAAASAGVFVNLELAVAFLNGLDGAFLGAGAAGNTIIGNFVSHGDLLF